VKLVLLRDTAITVRRREKRDFIPSSEKGKGLKGEEKNFPYLRKKMERGEKRYLPLEGEFHLSTL